MSDSLGNALIRVLPPPLSCPLALPLIPKLTTKSRMLAVKNRCINEYLIGLGTLIRASYRIYDVNAEKTENCKQGKKAFLVYRKLLRFVLSAEG